MDPELPNIQFTILHLHSLSPHSTPDTLLPSRLRSTTTQLRTVFELGCVSPILYLD